MRTLFSFLLFLLFTSNMMAQCTPPPSTYAEFQTCNATLAATYAPNIFQNSNTVYIDAVNGKADIPTNVDYDGDWDHLNNWDNLPSTSVSPSLYYSVHWTENYWVVVYTIYYARDYAVGLPDVGPVMAGICNLADEHEGDGSRIMIIIDRATSLIEGTVITGHGDHDSQVTAGSGLTLVGSNPTNLDISGNTATLYSAAGSHSLYYWLIGFEIFDQWNPCRPSVNQTSSYALGGGSGTTAYSLIDVLTPGGLWDNRYAPNLFRDDWQFKGDNRAKKKTPWAPWQGDRIEDMFNFLSDRFNGFDDNAFLFCPYDCDFEMSSTMNKSCNSSYTTEAITISAGLPKTADNLISEVEWFYDPLAFDCIGCDDPFNLAPTFINHNLQNGTWPIEGRRVRVKFETVDCGVQFLDHYIPSSNTDEIYINGYSTFNSGSPNNTQIKSFRLVGDDVGNVSNLEWTLGPNLTCVSGCYNGNIIEITPSPGAPDGNTYIEATFSNSGQNGCEFKIRQKITIDLDQPSLDFDYSSLNLEECAHSGDDITIPFNYHGTWTFGFPTINVDAKLIDIFSGAQISLLSSVTATHAPNQNGSPSQSFFIGLGEVVLTLPEDIDPGDYELEMTVSYSTLQGNGTQFASSLIDGEKYCHDYGLNWAGSTTYDCLLPLGSLCLVPCNIDVEIQFDTDQSGPIVNEMTAIVVSNDPESYNYFWSDESAENSVTINCGNETFSVTATNPLTGCVRVFTDIYLSTSVACIHKQDPELPNSGNGNSESDDEMPRTSSTDIFDESSDIKVYPNPGSGIFTISLAGNTSECTVSIYNLTSGRLMTSKKYLSSDQMEIDLTYLTPEIYLVKVFTEGKTFHKRIIKI